MQIDGLAARPGRAGEQRSALHLISDLPADGHPTIGRPTDALVALGWNADVAARFAESGAPRGGAPARIVRVERTRSIAVFSDGRERIVASATVPAVGDWISASDDVITTTVARRSSLSRLDPDGETVQVLAANVDVVLVTVPADRPNATRAERELAVAWASGAEPVVVLTKGDLAPPGLLAELRSRLVGVDLLFTSVRDGRGIDLLRARLQPNFTAVLLGPSGAGKSSLANTLTGADRLAVADVRSADGRGRHTTSSRQLLTIPGGGAIIDTPGLRGLGLIGGALDRVFPDVIAVIAQCRFGDCAHDAEPGCAVTAALRGGELDRERFASFCKLSAETSRRAHASGASSTPRAGAHRHRRHERPPEIDDEDDREDGEEFSTGPRQEPRR